MAVSKKTSVVGALIAKHSPTDCQRQLIGEVVIELTKDCLLFDIPHGSAQALETPLQVDAIRVLESKSSPLKRL